MDEKRDQRGKTTVRINASRALWVQKGGKRRPEVAQNAALGGHFGSLFLEKCVFQKPLFYLSKSMVFESRGGAGGSIEV